MRSKQVLDYVRLGNYVQRLQDVFLVSEGGWNETDRVLESIDDLLTHLEGFNLPVTLSATQELRQIRDEIARKKECDDYELFLVMQSLERTLEAELRGSEVFLPGDKRIDVTKLLSNVPALFAPNVFDLLPDIAKYDFGEACRCIALELPTAAAFHLMRGTEAVLRNFYLSIVRKDRLKQLNWGQVVDALRKRRTPPPASILDHLDNIRRSFRNPTQHPDKIYDIEEVQDLFNLCVDVVNRMVGSKNWKPNAT